MSQKQHTTVEDTTGLITQFTNIQGTVRVSQIDPDTTTNYLVPGVYSVHSSPLIGYYLQEEDLPSVPAKVYGNALERAELILNTYNSREGSTGVLLIGEKGQGKTLLTNILTRKLAKELNIPVLLISTAYAGAEFNSFINSLGNVALVFDEFGKMYKQTMQNGGNDTSVQNHLLTLFDGTASRKRLLLLTENNESLINEFIKGRPGRIYYTFKYKNVDIEIMEKYIADAGINEDKSAEIVNATSKISSMSMDVLKAIVEEVLRYPTHTITDIIERLNIEMKYYDSLTQFKIERFIPNESLINYGIDKVIDQSSIAVVGRCISIKNNVLEKMRFLGQEPDSDDIEYHSDPKHKFETDSIEVTQDKAKAVKGGKYIFTSIYGTFVGTFEAQDYRSYGWGVF